MKQQLLTILIILTFIQNVKSQDKVINGDTTFWYISNQAHKTILELPDLDKTQTDFAFRFWNNDEQVVDIVKDGNKIYGEITNYISHSIGKKRETLFSKTKLDSIKSINAYEVVQTSGIIYLKSDKDINGWRQGRDGAIYNIEYSNKSEYWHNNYYEPLGQDSLPESLIVADFVKALSDTLHLSESYKMFKDGLPKMGTYQSRGMVTTRYLSNSYRFGYSGSTKLPIGFNSSIYLKYIGKIHTEFGLGFQYKYDRKNNDDIGVYVSKSNIFLKESSINDFVIYNYQKRRLDFVDTNTDFINHQLICGLSINGLVIGAGINHMIGIKEKNGGVIRVSNYLNRYDTFLETSIFKDEFDYKVGISRLIKIRHGYVIRSTSIDLYFENFNDYNDLNFGFKFWLSN